MPFFHILLCFYFPYHSITHRRRKREACLYAYFRKKERVTLFTPFYSLFLHHYFYVSASSSYPFFENKLMFPVFILVSHSVNESHCVFESTYMPICQIFSSSSNSTPFFHACTTLLQIAAQHFSPADNKRTVMTLLPLKSHFTPFSSP